jgi:hypothetical protein
MRKSPSTELWIRIILEEESLFLTDRLLFLVAMKAIERNCTVQDIVRDTGLHYNSLSNFLKGRNLPSGHMINALDKWVGGM